MFLDGTVLAGESDNCFVRLKKSLANRVADDDVEDEKRRSDGMLMQECVLYALVVVVREETRGVNGKGRGQMDLYPSAYPFPV